MLTRSAVLAVAVLVACGGGTAANQVDGTVGGHSIANPNAVLAQTTVEGVPATVVFISPITNLCSELQSGFQVKNASLLELAAWVADSSGTGVPATDAGTYVLNLYGTPPLYEGGVTFGATDGNCSPIVDAEQGSGEFGQIIFTDLSPSHAAGTFNATVGSQGDHLSGSFDATACDLTQSSAGTCH